LIARLATRRVVDPSADTAVEPTALLSIHRVYAQSPLSGRSCGPAFVRRQVSWPKSAQTCSSPAARPAATSVRPPPLRPTGCTGFPPTAGQTRLFPASAAYQGNGPRALLSAAWREDERRAQSRVVGDGPRASQAAHTRGRAPAESGARRAR